MRLYNTQDFTLIGLGIAYSSCQADFNLIISTAVRIHRNLKNNYWYQFRYFPVLQYFSLGKSAEKSNKWISSHAIQN